MDATYTRKPESLDIIFEILADQRRRYAFHCLKSYEAPLALADLAEEVAIRENDSPITEIPAEDVKRTYMSLYHTHIPKLEDANIVHYDQNTDSVALAEDSEQLEPYTKTRATDNVYDCLANEQRRRLLFSLLVENSQTASPIDLDTLLDITVFDYPQIVKYQYVHLPKLDDHGFINWIPDTCFVEKGPEFGEIKPVLKLLAEHDAR